MNHSITFNGIYKLVLNLFRFTLPVVIIPYVYRTISADNIGAVDYAESIYSYINFLAVLGISYYAIRELGIIRNKKIKASQLFSNIFVVNIMTVLFSLFVYLIILLFFISDDKVYLISLVLMFKLFLLLFDIEWVNEAYEEYKFISIKTMFCRSISLILMYFLVTTKEDYLIYVWLNVLFDTTNSLISLYYILIYRKKVFFSFRLIKLSLIKKYFKNIIATLFVIDIGFFFFSFDKIMLGIYASNKEVAYYSLVQKIILITVVLSSTLTQVTLPRLSILANQDRVAFSIFVQKIYTALMMIVIPSLFGVLFLSKEILYFFGSVEYFGAVNIMHIFSFYLLIFVFLKVIGSQVLFALNKEKVIILLLFIFGGINIFIKFFIRNYQTAEISILITMILLFIMCLFLYIYIYFKEKIVIKLLNSSIIIYLFASIPIFILPFVRKYFDNIYLFMFSSVIYSAITYSLILFICKEEISQSLIKKVLIKFN
ncbi:oligosaccharide flippase family protein [Arsenophonus nasoniae]|uniref:oligosaccharide flippase family protein n=1 Tax=Arsenophonus nasoniae TaxID=638 RepID=UPI0038793107